MMPVCSHSRDSSPGANFEHMAPRQQHHAEADQHQAAGDLDRRGIGEHHVGNRRHAEGGNGRERAVAEHGTEPRGNAAEEAARDGALDAEHIHGADRRRHQHADPDAGKHQLDAGQHDLRAGLQDPLPSFRMRFAARRLGAIEVRPSSAKR